jgi:hypothetical protein
MISKKEYTNSIEMQLLKKEKASLESRVFKQERDQESLREKIKLLETEKESLGKLIENAEKKGDISAVALSDIKLRANIRDEYQYEEIEDLARDIMVNSQLQPVLITGDNYLISGHRRYFAVKLINSDPEALKPARETGKALNMPEHLVVYRIERLSSEISDLELHELQYAENNERRAIDNFQLSKLYNGYLEKGFEQKDIVTRFNKTKGNISSVISLKKIEPRLVRWLKEFQIYSWSKARYHQENSSEMTDLQKQFYHNNKGIIGWKPLYNIAKQESLTEQKKMFLELFANRLSEAELNSEFFSGVLEKEAARESTLFITGSALKQTKNLAKLVEKLKETAGFNGEAQVAEILSDLKRIELKLAGFQN